MIASVTPYSPCISEASGLPCIAPATVRMPSTRAAISGRSTSTCRSSFAPFEWPIRMMRRASLAVIRSICAAMSFALDATSLRPPTPRTSAVKPASRASLTTSANE
jgi:hypothetical protein